MSVLLKKMQIFRFIAVFFTILREDLCDGQGHHKTLEPQLKQKLRQTANIDEVWQNTKKNVADWSMEYIDKSSIEYESFHESFV